MVAPGQQNDSRGLPPAHARRQAMRGRGASCSRDAERRGSSRLLTGLSHVLEPGERGLPAGRAPVRRPPSHRRDRAPRSCPRPGRRAVTRGPGLRPGRESAGRMPVRRRAVPRGTTSAKTDARWTIDRSSEDLRIPGRHACSFSSALAFSAFPLRRHSRNGQNGVRRGRRPAVRHPGAGRSTAVGLGCPCEAHGHRIIPERKSRTHPTSSRLGHSRPSLPACGRG